MGVEKLSYPQERINFQISESTSTTYTVRFHSYFASDVRIDLNCKIAFASSCLVIYEGNEVVKAEKKTKKNDEECEMFEGATVCVTKYEDRKLGTFACQLSIEDMNEDLVGKWMQYSTQYLSQIFVMIIDN